MQSNKSTELAPGPKGIIEEEEKEVFVTSTSARCLVLQARKSVPMFDMEIIRSCDVVSAIRIQEVRFETSFNFAWGYSSTSLPNHTKKSMRGNYSGSQKVFQFNMSESSRQE